MRKKGLTVFILLALLLSGCGEKTQSRAEELQQRYAQMQSYEALVEVSVPREDETLHYTLSLEKSGDSVRAAVIEPEELTGIAATLTGDALTLEYDGMALDAGTLSPRVSALNCVPLVLDGFSRAYLASVGSETLDGKDTLRADFSMTLGDETLGGTVWFTDGGTPVYLEASEDGKIIAAAEFTNFVFGDILPSSTQN